MSGDLSDYKFERVISDSVEAFKVVGSIIDMEKNKKLPEGFKLISVQVLANKDRAIAS